ncbi:Piwi-like protein 1 [Hypsibius exemplaris]|uniref:Piwi-like protein 1 n=1 Tax=Hypsibius exemplaris TaxID=2072580 RepID=A0A1W0X4M4_HYPEX|nr:Piwi-like protein 1 [Hypsibius exemplaris]
MAGRGYGRGAGVCAARAPAAPDLGSLNLQEPTFGQREGNSGGESQPDLGRSRGWGDLKPAGAPTTVVVATPGPPGPAVATGSRTRTISGGSIITVTQSNEGKQRMDGNFDPKGACTFRVPRKFRGRFKTWTPFEKTIGTDRDGKLIPLKTNYFALQDPTHSPDYLIAYLTVNFDPYVKNKMQRHVIVESMRCFQDVSFYYDGRMGVFIAAHNKQLIFGANNELLENFSSNLNGEVKLTFMKNIGDPADLDDNNFNTTHGVLNSAFAKILVKRGYPESMVQVRDGFYMQKGYKEISGLAGLSYKLNVWPGLKPLLMKYDGGLLMNLDLCNLFFRSGTVLDAIKAVGNSRDVGTEAHCRAATEVLKGMVIITPYNQHCAYRIREVTPDLAGFEHSFTRKTTDKTTYESLQQQLSVKDYLCKVYNMVIQHPTQPLIYCEKLDADTLERPRQKRKTENDDPKLDWSLLVPEHCWLTGVTDDLKRNFKNWNAILESAKKEPTERAALLRTFAVNLEKNVEARRILTNWAMKLGVDLEDVMGRELPLVQLLQSQKPVPYERKDVDWTKNLRGGRLDEPKVVKSFTLVYAAQQEQQAKALYELLNKVGRPMGMDFEFPQIVPVASNDLKAFADAIRVAKKGSDIVMCLLPDDKKERYDAIKLETTRPGNGVPSQCILFKNATNVKSAMSIVTKVALQMNAKMGGALWHIKNPAIKGDGVMVVGCVVGRAVNMKKTKTAAFVASINSTYSSFASSADFFHSDTIDPATYRKHMGDLVNAYKDANQGKVPETVIIYRAMDREDEMYDVVGVRKPDGTLISGEVHLAADVLRELIGVNVKLMYCIALKKCSTRFFSEQMGNVQPGTIVDRKITIPGRNDFYLVSHCGRRGTVSPMYYFAVSDNTGIEFVDFQNFTFQMTHMYYNWSGTVKLPAVCQYAFKLATVMGEHSKIAPDPILNRKLWFL